MEQQEKIAMLCNRMEISDLLSRYCRGIDRLDKKLISDVYWPDAIDNHGVYNGPAVDFADFIIPLLNDLYLSTLHMLGQSSVEISGDFASAETYFHAQHQLREGGGSFLEHVGGRYVDRLARRSDQWKIIDRTVVFDFISRADSVPNNMDTHGFIFGNRSSEDISYANFSG